MTIDGIMLRAVISELSELCGARVDKVYQPANDEVHLLLRTQSRNVRLLLSANASNCRLHLTEHAKPNPDHPPMFCMLLRKHLTNAKIVSVSQLELERVVTIEFDAVNEMGDHVCLRLVTEIMGRHSNIILVDENGIIIDSSKHVNATMSSVRLVLPGQSYILAPSQGKLNPMTVTQQTLVEAFDSKRTGALDSYICSLLMGVSLPCAQELILRAFGKDNLFEVLTPEQSERLSQTIVEFFADARDNHFSPALLCKNGLPFGFVPFSYLSHSPSAHIPMSANAAVDGYYSLKESNERFSQRVMALTKSIEARLKKDQKKLSMQTEALMSDDRMQTAKLYGELLTANMHKLPRGSKSILVNNYYDNTELSVPLDPSLSPAENAQRYFKQYAKLRMAQSLAKEQVDLLTEDIEYLETQLLNISQCSELDELSQIRLELEEEGYLKKTFSKKKVPPIISTPLNFISSDGYEIYVGKNNTQNDMLTLKADGNDMWLHVKNMPGSHVIIKEKDGVSTKAIYEGAMLAAYYSKGKHSQNVPVDYCLRKYVKKPAKAKPGMVIYTTNKTAYVTPQEEFVSRLRR